MYCTRHTALGSTMFVFIATMLLLQSASSASINPKCGVTNVQPILDRALTRIVGGTEARPNSFPWVVNLQIVHITGLQPYCGATLIRACASVEASDILVTAAHCLEGPTYALLGAHSLSKSQPGQKLIEIEKTVAHPEYNPLTLKNDIAIVKLKRLVNFTDTIQPACLPKLLEKIADGVQGFAAGWGLTKEGGTSADKLQQAVLPYYNMQQCINDYQKSSPIDAQFQFCAGYKNGKSDACSQDSGGPWLAKNSDGRYVLQGVVSYGVGCARPNYPGIYSRVSYYVPWITNKIKQLSAVKKRS